MPLSWPREDITHSTLRNYLEKVEVDDRTVAFSIFTHSHSFLSESETYAKTKFSSGDGHCTLNKITYNANSAGKKSISNFEEPVSSFLDIGDVFAFSSDIGVSVQHAVFRHSHIGELDSGIIDSIESDFVAKIFEPDLN